MSRLITVLFRRDPSRDRHKGDIFFEGYEVLWPNGRCFSFSLLLFVLEFVLFLLLLMI